jgi:hypothetical protein
VKKGTAWRQLNISPYSAVLRFANPPKEYSSPFDAPPLADSYVDGDTSRRWASRGSGNSGSAFDDKASGGDDKQGVYDPKETDRLLDQDRLQMVEKGQPGLLQVLDAARAQLEAEEQIKLFNLKKCRARSQGKEAGCARRNGGAAVSAR